jgi:hypothetical protein
MSIEAPAPPHPAARLAAEYDAPTLAGALVARLLADGRAELAAGLRALLSGGAVGIIDPTPPYPRT